MRKLDPHTLLSVLWLFILLNIIFRDMHQFVLVQVPIAMVIFSLLLTRRIGRPVTILAAIITTGTLLSFAPTDLDDTFHLVIEFAALAAILWTAWTWTDQEGAAAQGGDQPL